MNNRFQVVLIELKERERERETKEGRKEEGGVVRERKEGRRKEGMHTYIYTSCFISGTPQNRLEATQLGTESRITPYGVPNF